MRRKLQVFEAGHIPAGMELFQPGNETQLTTIFKWIDESDAYMLILGGRYGSIEPKSGKSYTQLEYEYALQKGASFPTFAVVLSDDFITNKIVKQGISSVQEQVNVQKYQEFKKFVLTKIVRSVNDSKDIMVAVTTKLVELSEMSSLTGWIRENSSPKLSRLEQNIISLKLENAQLEDKLNDLQKKVGFYDKKANAIGEYSFDKIYEILYSKKFLLYDNFFSDDPIHTNALNVFMLYYNKLCAGIISDCNAIKNDSYLENMYFFYNIAPYFLTFELIEKVEISGTTLVKYQLTNNGHKLMRLLISRTDITNPIYSTYL